MCQRCGGEQPKTKCMSEKEKCANCVEEHESSYHQCAIYQNKLEAKINKIISDNGPAGSFSQWVISSQTDMQKQIIESNKTMILDLFISSIGSYRNIKNFEVCIEIDLFSDHFPIKNQLVVKQNNNINKKDNSQIKITPQFDYSRANWKKLKIS